MKVCFLLRAEPRKYAMIAAGNLILAFGLYNIHAQTNVTEGGVLGIMLLLKYWLNISPAYSGVVLDILCFAFGVYILGKDFLGYSLFASIVFAVCYRILELFPPLWPDLYRYPLAASLIGACFVGVGVGISVRSGAATGGDDAVAMALHHMTGIDIQWLYLITDLSVLALSLTYIPISRLVWSILSVVLSGQIIGWIQKIRPQKA